MGALPVAAESRSIVRVNITDVRIAAPPPEHRLDLDGLSRVVDVIEEHLKS